MLGPRLDGTQGVALVPSTLEHFKLQPKWELEPEVTRFWGPRFGDFTEESLDKRFRDAAQSQTQVRWTISYGEEPVGFTGIFGIDWVRRDGESGIFIGRHDLSEASRARPYGCAPLSRGTNSGCIACTTGSATLTAAPGARIRSPDTGRWVFCRGHTSARPSGTTSGSAKRSRAPSPRRPELVRCMCPTGAAATRVTTRVE